MYIQVAQDPFIKKAIEIYRQDVCEPNLTELMVILEKGGYRLPAKYNVISASKSVQELGNIHTDAINDRFIFSTIGFMNLWNMGAAHSFRTEVRNAFIRNYHRANR